MREMSELELLIYRLVCGLAGQQAMPDDSWQPQLRAALDAVHALELRGAAAIEAQETTQNEIDGLNSRLRNLVGESEARRHRIRQLEEAQAGQEGEIARLRGLLRRALEIVGAWPMSADQIITDERWEDDVRAALLSRAGAEEGKEGE